MIVDRAPPVVADMPSAMVPAVVKVCDRSAADSAAGKAVMLEFPGML